MTPTSADPGAIDLEKHRTGGASNLALIAAAEALRERVAALERRYELYKHIAKGVRGALDGEHTQRDILREFDLVVDRAETAEAHMAELAGALGLVFDTDELTRKDEYCSTSLVNARNRTRAVLATTSAKALERATNELELSLKEALMAGIQTGVGETFHPDAKALICIAFKNGADAVKFHLAYIKLRAKLDTLGKEEGGPDLGNPPPTQGDNS